MNFIAKYSGIVKLIFVTIVIPLAVMGFCMKKIVGLKQLTRGQQQRIDVLGMKIESDDIPYPSVTKVSVGPWLKNGELLNSVEPLAELHGVTVESYVPYLTAGDGGAELYTGEMILSGGFHSLTRLIHILEKHTENYRIVSAGYRTHEIPQTMKKNLRLTIVLQEINMISHPNNTDEK